MKGFNLKVRGKVLYSVPIAIASSALAVSVIAPQIARASTSTLAPVSPEQLVSWIQAAHPISLNGTVTGITSFPIPLPSLVKSSNPQSALGGSTTETYNVWSNGRGSFRSQQVTNGGETDLYVNPGSVWYWNSSTLTATNETRSGSSGGQSGVQATGSNPSATASEIVSRLSAFSTLSVSGSQMVAGRPAYTLSLTPTAADSLIGSVQIAIDGETHVPVQIQVFPKGSSTPAASFGFNTLTVAPQPTSVFSFTPPAGAKVVEPSTQVPTASAQGTSKAASGNKIVGTGFDSVAVIGLSAKQLSGIGAIEKSLPTVATPAGVGYLYSTPIFQAVILPNGTVVAGAVETARIMQVISGL